MPNLFDFINSVNKKTKLTDLQGYSQWMMNRFMCSEQNYVPFIAEINCGYNLSDKMHYDFLFNVIPKSSRFMRYNMKKEAKDKELQYVMSYYNVSLEVAKSYIHLMEKEELEEIVSYFEDRGTKGSKPKKGKK